MRRDLHGRRTYKCMPSRLRWMPCSGADKGRGGGVPTVYLCSTDVEH